MYTWQARGISFTAERSKFLHKAWADTAFHLHLPANFINIQLLEMLTCVDYVLSLCSTYGPSPIKKGGHLFYCSNKLSVAETSSTELQLQVLERIHLPENINPLPGRWERQQMLTTPWSRMPDHQEQLATGGISFQIRLWQHAMALKSPSKPSTARELHPPGNRSRVQTPGISALHRKANPSLQNGPALLS